MKQCSSGGRLSAAGLAHQPQGFALSYEERDVVHCSYGATSPGEHSAADGKVFPEIMGLDEYVVAHCEPS